MSLEVMDFDSLTPNEVQVKKDGKSYILREASSDAVCRWRNAILKTTKYGPEGKPEHIDGLHDADPLLVALCLVEEVTLPNGAIARQPVSVATVRSWPYRMQKALYDRAKEISDLNEVEDTEETLTKQMQQTQTKLDRLRNSQNGEHLGNVYATTDGSS
jgi:hypothetical protein